MQDKNTSEDISCHQNSTKLMDHTCNDNANNVLNIEEKAYVTSIHSINANNDISINDDDSYIHNYYAPFLSSNNHEDLSSGSEYDSAKWRVCCNKNMILDLILNKSRSFEWQVTLLFFVLNDNKFSSHMDQISEHINYSNQKIQYYDKMIKIILNLCNNKCEYKNNSTCQLNHLQIL